MGWLGKIYHLLEGSSHRAPDSALTRRVASSVPMIVAEREGIDIFQLWQTPSIGVVVHRHTHAMSPMSSARTLHEARCGVRVDVRSSMGFSFQERSVSVRGTATIIIMTFLSFSLEPRVSELCADRPRELLSVLIGYEEGRGVRVVEMDSSRKGYLRHTRSETGWVVEMVVLD